VKPHKELESEYLCAVLGMR